MFGKEARLRREKLKRAGELPPGALDGMRHLVEMQLYSTLGKNITMWVNEKKGRKFVMENDGDEPGVSITFTESGVEVQPDFMPAEKEAPR